MTKQSDYIASCSYQPLEQLTQSEVEALWKELELKAFEGDSDRVSELLDQYPNKIPKKNLNAALRGAVRGCNT